MASDTTRMSIDVSKDLYKLIKCSATFKEQTIKDFVVDAIKDRLKVELKTQRRELNELTARTFEKSDRGEELETYESVDAFFESLSEEDE